MLRVRFLWRCLVVAILMAGLPPAWTRRLSDRLPAFFDPNKLLTHHYRWKVEDWAKPQWISAPAAIVDLDLRQPPAEVKVPAGYDQVLALNTDGLDILVGVSTLD